MAAVMTFSWVASSRSKMPICLPSRMTRMRSLMASTSGRSDEMRMMPRPSAARSLIMWWTSALAPTSMPRVGSSRMRSLGWALSHLLNITFCWLPPESFSTSTLTEGVRIESFSWNSSAVAISVSLPDQAQAIQVSAQHGQRDVGRDRHGHDQAELAAVFGHIGDAKSKRLLGRADHLFLPFKDDLARVGRLDAEQGQATSVRREPIRPAKPNTSP